MSAIYESRIIVYILRIGVDRSLPIQVKLEIIGIVGPLWSLLDKQTVSLSIFRTIDSHFESEVSFVHPSNFKQFHASLIDSHAASTRRPQTALQVPWEPHKLSRGEITGGNSTSG